MRKIIVLSFVSLDGVMQGPGGPTEDTSGDFTNGGWTVPFFDEALGEIMGAQMGQPFDLLLGRKTFEIFASYWPHQEGENPIDEATKYVASNTLTVHSWKKSVFLKGDFGQQLRLIKASDGPDLHVHGSAQLIQSLLAEDLVDEFWLKFFPVTLGRGKRLFGEGTLPAAFTLKESTTTPGGVIVASFAREGAIQTGSF